MTSPADVPGALRLITVAGHDIIELFSGHGGARVRYFLSVRLDVGGRVRAIKRLEVLAGLVRVVGKGHVGVCRVHAKPPALDLGHVPHQTQQRQLGRRDRPLLELVGGQASALEGHRSVKLGSPLANLGTPGAKTGRLPDVLAGLACLRSLREFRRPEGGHP